MEHQLRTMWSRVQELCGCGDYATPTDRRNNRAITVWSLVWTAVFLSSLATMEWYGDDSLAISSGALAAASLVMIPLIRAYVRFVREADELTRMIQLQAMAVGFGAGFVIAVLHRFLERVVSLMPELDPLEPLNFLNPFVAMILAYVVSTLILQRRYSR